MFRIKRSKNQFKNQFATFAFLGLALGWLAYSSVQAAGLSEVMVRFDRLATSQATTGTICANPATTATENSVVVSFPAGYTVSTTVGDWTVDTDNTAWPDGATAWLGVATATDVSGQDVTFPSSSLTPGTLYCFNWNDSAALTTSATASPNNQGSVTTRDSGAATIDSGQYATVSVDDDQILVTAAVDATFNFSLSGNTDNLGTLDDATPVDSTTPRTATINTNASNGWQVWAKSNNTGLSSATASHTISSTTPGANSTLTAGTEGYNTGVTFLSQVDGNGTVAISPVFLGGGAGSFQGGGLDNLLRTVATSDGTAQDSVIQFRNNASISSVTPPAVDYSDIITIIAAGLF